jgi:nucleotide-binding universal stress UspA family protein
MTRSFRRIVHPTDFSTASRPAFRRAVALATANHATLSILHVLPALPIMADAYIAPSTYTQLLESQRGQARKQLARLVAQARAGGARVTGHMIEAGVAAERIVRFARSRRADLIVMGTHGRTGLARALIGSVAGRVVAIARCPVLTVHA